MAGLMLARKMGSTYSTATTVTCSLVCAVLLDHMGWVGFEVHRIRDLKYAMSRSVSMDLKILFKTPRAVLTGDGAY
jgi:hypothetical protein